MFDYIKPPDQAQATATQNPWAGTAYDNGFLDLDALYRTSQANQGAIGGADFLKALKPLSGVTLKEQDFYNAALASTAGYTDAERAEYLSGLNLTYQDAAGRTFRQTGTDANGNPLIQFFDNGGGGCQNPTGDGSDRVQPTYTLGKDGTATPVDAGTFHKDSAWVDWGRDVAKLAAVAATAGVGGAALQGAGVGAAGGGAAGVGASGAGLSSADLAALYGAEGYGAGAGAGGITTAGSTAGLGGLGMNGSSSIAAQLGAEAGAGMAPAAGAAGGSGATNAALIDSALGTPGYGASSAGLGGGSGMGFFDSLGSYLGSDSGLKTLGNVGSTLINAYQSNQALGAQQDATREANALQKYMYDTTRADWAPYRALGSVGTTGYANLLKDPSSITSNPGYQFQLGQGQQAIDRSAASKGSLYSGATLKASQRFGQGLASTSYDNALSRFGNAAQIGATGVSGSAAAGTNYANQAGANTTGLGNAAAGQALYNGSLYGNALTQGVSAYTNQGKPWWQQGG